MDITITLDKTCSTGEHLQFTATNSFGKSKILVLTREEFKDFKDDWEDTIIILLKNFIKESGLTNWNQIKTALGTRVFKI
ncbi:MAG: hypothetical protein A2W23_06300 [Planctomycetes bacterium RBG_16_43_13]|nr:MAG: hypothetical protein A2W23_06300 [Planctomycetes bacterium RBG_16_43_13]